MNAQRIPPDGSNKDPWFSQVLWTYAALCRCCLSAIDAALSAWVDGTELNTEHRTTIAEWVMHGGTNFEISRALVELLAQIEMGRRPTRIVPPGAILDQLQRRILEIWAGEMRQLNPSDSLARAIEVVLATTDENKVLTADDRDVIEAYAIGEGPRGRALRRALEVYGGQVDGGPADNDQGSCSELQMAKAIQTSDLSALPEADRAVIAHFDAAFHGASPGPGSDEAAAVAAMKRFLDELRGTPVAARDPGLGLTEGAVQVVQAVQFVEVWAATLQVPIETVEQLLLEYNNLLRMPSR